MSLLSSQIPSSILAVWCRQIGTAVNAGLPLLAVLESEAIRPTVRRITQSAWLGIVDAVRCGDTLGNALQKYEEFFPKMFISMVKVGEDTGHLGDTLLELAAYYEKLVQARKAFYAALAWPIIELNLALTVIGLLILVLGFLPKNPDGGANDILGLGLIGVAGFIKYVTFLAIVFISGTACYWYCKRNIPRIGWMLYIVDRIPKVGPVFRTFALVRLTRAIHLTTATGMDIFEAVDLAFNATAYAPISNKIKSVKDVLTEGGSIYEAFGASRTFNDLILMQLHIGEQSGTIPEAMNRISDQYMDEGMLRLKTLSAIGQALVLVFIMGIMIMMIFQIAGFYIGTLNDALKPI